MGRQRRLKPFDVKLHYTQRHPLPRQIEEELDLTFHRTPQERAKVCDVVTINAPLYPGTKGLFNEGALKSMKRGSYLVNTVRAEICDRDASVRNLQEGYLAG